ncbi:hybrid sensor histidine kinase/response regulator [Sphingobium sp. 22B]|uniref:ATP-binding protein n=1 Tax=unclassified Sphingobium TaxID=2611147 RepID=UPI000783C73E|nr:MULTISPECIES: ATP-binding protein [unclassified Sphingobium]KXU29210.1 hybrid sensor histidine kinase/response regulator [Sphingobium sp. AM]KYC32678.1 hybrid sensor histidine kinase/response regulator [Sphingobium sp. 22B]OAP29398.1 hybrid sensor histidine kinase/response regulator [Sphingobium sp. 20006FA]
MDRKLASERGAEQKALAARWTIAAEAMEALAGARSMEAIINVLRAFARRAVGADGIAVVLRDEDQCHYIAEDSMEPLWAGQRFPASSCVSGWAMEHHRTAVIPDVFDDPRVPVEAYRTTFVRSMVMVPIGRIEPMAALGAYWSEFAQPTDNEIALLEALARAASTALENGRLFASLEALNDQLERRVRERTTELERSQDSLRQVQKLDMLGQLTGHVAHDFNNLLMPIVGGLDLILSGKRTPESIERHATIAMQAAESAQTLVQRLLTFARRQPLTAKAVDLSDLLGGMQALLTSTLGPRIALTVDLQPMLPPVRADAHQLEVALLNLAVNGRDAMPDGGALSIKAQARQSRLPAALTPGPYVCLTVSDTGTGMTPAVKAAAMEPFFTTKPSGHGTGLGLSMVHGLAAQLGGTVEIDSAVGQGTSVRLWLPVERAPAVKAASPAVEEGPKERSGKVLLVDDNDLVRNSTREMLIDMGYEVVDTDRAERALSMIESGDRPDILITDHIMPGMTGVELALRLRADHPHIALLIISGYEGVDLIAPDITRLSKPFRHNHLQACIAAARAQAA